jgi:DNA uptake protein ComE-like DNA-binding protein
MQPLNVRSLCILSLVSVLMGITACTSNGGDNPDEIRRRTAEATETVRRDAKAMAEGVKEGMGRDNKAININKASREELLTLPGLSEHEADHIIAARPFDNADDLVRRRVIPDSEYDKIRDRVIAGH